MVSEKNGFRRRLAVAIKERRAALGLTQEEAADRCGLSTRFLRHVEAAHGGISFEAVVGIMTGLEWSWEELDLALQGRRPCREPPGAAPHAHRLLDTVWKQANEPDRRMIVRLLTHLTRRP